MLGKEVFRHAVVNLAEVVRETLGAVGMQPSEIDWLVPHQANKRIIDGTARKLGMSTDRVVLTVDRHGNTSAASVPLAQIGRASCRERVCQDVSISVVAGSLNKKNHTKYRQSQAYF